MDLASIIPMPYPWETFTPSFIVIWLLAPKLWLRTDVPQIIYCDLDLWNNVTIFACDTLSWYGEHSWQHSSKSAIIINVMVRKRLKTLSVTWTFSPGIRFCACKTPSWYEEKPYQASVQSDHWQKRVWNWFWKNNSWDLDLWPKISTFTHDTLFWYGESHSKLHLDPTINSEVSTNINSDLDF